MNSEFIAIQQRKAAKKKLEEAAKKAALEEKGFEELAEVMIKAGRISSSRSGGEISSDDKKQLYTQIYQKFLDSNTKYIHEFLSSMIRRMRVPPNQPSKQPEQPAAKTKSEAETPRACHSSSCSSAGLFLCSGCLEVSYCSEACSREGWKRHREGCRREARRRAEGEVD